MGKGNRTGKQDAEKRRQGKGAAKPTRRSTSTKRSRFKTAADAKSQLEGIEKAQVRVRAGEAGRIIDAIDKSRQRLRNELNKVRTAEDAREQFEA